ncbi:MULTISPECIES: hypothetical protein [Niallia]|jgi:hypothetical protein|uniref:Uncharacterized protein n=1 Tax=Niallia circulans TaxID=1397 RepID=A0A268FGW8_NIACI|nr:hypothetical protein [Niallia circulans]AYV66596.1 hypothetical protein C2I06_06730 [Niallia circulans]AYV70582.1 hypothetical protein C2H98_02860 [Niallia circulans]NRG27734.1 hypothetical protein [Niallia circulans]PAD84633.1 hypothetical protein CHH57_03335 [Niallia circulans]QJX62485.1 hypothetical protein HLK66_13045 [Niallia circulans]
MSSTKINISPVENTYIRLILAIENMDKEKLVDLGDSYLLKVNKKNKSGNELHFSMLFNKKLINKVARSTNPTVNITKNKHLISLEITIMLDLTEPIKEENFFWIKKEFASTPAFEISYKMNEEYFDKKILQHLNKEANEESTEV